MHSRLSFLLSMRRVVGICVLSWLLAVAGLVGHGTVSLAQEPQSESAARQTEDLQQLAAEAARNRSQSISSSLRTKSGDLNFLDLLKQGGVLMIPIGLLSMLVVSITIERFFALQSARVLPRRLRRALHEKAEQHHPVDPQELYQLSLKYPSVTSRVLDAMIRKIGRPIRELEMAIQDECQREADKMYSSVRWLSLSAGVAPLIGLLGTVWGMILAFFHTTQLAPGSNRAEQLSEGIYIAFVNTLGGLAVAIPAAIFAHYFEGRILKQLHRVQEALRSIVPKLERYEGNIRYDLTESGLVVRKPAEVTPGGMPTSTASTVVAGSEYPSVVGGSHLLQPPREIPRTTKSKANPPLGL